MSALNLFHKAQKIKNGYRKAERYRLVVPGGYAC